MGDLGDAYAAMSVQKCPCGAQPQGHPSGLCDACVAKRIVDRPAPTPTPAPGLDLDAVDIMPKPGETWHTGEDLALLLAAARAEIARLTAELAAARAEVDCGQDGPCAKAPGCARHWQERNRELVAELAAARAVPADVEAAMRHYGEVNSSPCWTAKGHADAEDALRTAIARAISDATAARGTVGGLLATAPVARPLSEWHEDHGDVLWWRFPIDEPPYCGSPLDDNWPDYHTHWTPIVCPDDPSQRGPLPKGG